MQYLLNYVCHLLQINVCFLISAILHAVKIYKPKLHPTLRIDVTSLCMLCKAGLTCTVLANLCERVKRCGWNASEYVETHYDVTSIPKGIKCWFYALIFQFWDSCVNCIGSLSFFYLSQTIPSIYSNVLETETFVFLMMFCLLVFFNILKKMIWLNLANLHLYIKMHRKT